MSAIMSEFLSSNSAMSRISCEFRPNAAPRASWIIISEAFSATILSPAMAMNEAALAATPSMRVVTVAAWFFSAL
jgi:hypothetical protein